MRTFAKEKTSTAVSENGASSTSNSEGTGSWFRMHWRLISLFVIIAVAFILRFAFAYGISAGDNYALSGGSSASSHLRIITEILSGSYDPSSQSSVGYPYGAESIYGPLFDYVMAFFAFIVSACGVSDATAAAGTLAWSAPILGAITCFPVYLIGKKIFKGDEVIGIVSALFYAVFAIGIMTTAFSNGTEYPFVCFLMAWFIYFIICAFEAAENTRAEGIKSVISVNSVRSYTLLAAVFLAFIVLSWNEFWAIMMAAAIMIFFALLFERLGGKDLGVTVGITSIILLVAVLVGAIYYIPNGQWEAVFSGGCLVGLLAVAYSFIFLAVEKKPWVMTIPLMLVIIGVVAAVFAVALPELSSAMVHGNNYYQGELMSELADQFTRTSISQMASFYGWITMWFPFIFGIWMLYKLRAHAKSRVYVFTMLWMFAAFFVGWFSTDYAVVAGAAFAVGAAAIVVKVIQAVDVESYLKSLRGVKGAGFKAGAKKVLNFFPFITVIVAVCLVAAPAAVYAADAATPTNDEHADYFGGLGYTINTSDSSLVSATWDNYKGNTDNGALVTWYGYSDAASSVGGFSTVTSSNGNGVSAMASTYLSDGSNGALASMIIRLVENGAAKYQSIFNNNGVGDVVKLIDSNKAARQYISDNVADFEGYNSSLASESLAYVAGVHYLTSSDSKLNESQLTDLYNQLCAETGHKIGYVEVDSSMIPLYYGDGSYTNTMGYFGDYSQDKYGAPAEFYTVSSTTEMYYQYGYYDQLYYTYNNAFYDTFLWNALVGVTPEQYGLSSSVSLLSELTHSDGTVKAVPATGMGSFKVGYWHVMYQAKDSSSWTDMDAYEAIAKQNAEGGYINYLASVVVLEFASSSTTASATVTVGSDALANVKVAVFEKTGYDASGATSYVQRSTAYTDKDGKFTVAVPATGDFLVRYYVGSDSLRDGTIIATEKNTVSGLTRSTVSQVVTLVSTGDTPFQNSGCTLTFVGSDGKIKENVSVDSLTAATPTLNLVPDVYTINVYGPTGTLLNTVTMPIVETISNLCISAGACEVDITVSDMYGNDSIIGTVVKLVGFAGETFEATVSGGSATVYVPAGTYNVFINNADYVSTATTSVTASAKGSSSVSLTVYKSGAAPLAEGVWSALGYTVVSDGSTYAPANIASVLTQSAAGSTISGKLLNADGKVAAGTVAFITNVNETYLFGAGSDGLFTATVPNGSYVVYATNGTDLAYYGTLEVSGDRPVEFKMGKAYSVTETVNYTTLMSPSTRGIAYVPLEFAVTIGGANYAIPAVTGADGTYKLFVPSESSVKWVVKADAVNGYGFSVTDDFTDSKEMISSNCSLKFTIGEGDVTSITLGTTVSIKDQDGNDVKDISLKLDTSGSEYDLYLKITGGTAAFYKDAAYSVPATVIHPGKYTVTSEVDGFFVKDTLTVYPGDSSVNVSLKVIASFTVEVTDMSNTVTCVPLKKDDGTVGTYDSKAGKYYLEDGYDFYFVVANSDKTQIGYSDIFSAAGTYAPILGEKVVLSGYLGSKLSGVMNVQTSSFFVQVTVKDGEYSVDLPKNTVLPTTGLKLTASYEGSEYTYKVIDLEILADNIIVSEDTVMNLAVKTERTLTETKVVIDEGSSMSAGFASLKLSITNAEDYDVTYLIGGSDALVLMKAYFVTVEAGQTKNVTVYGYYNQFTLGAGSSKATVVVTNVADGNVLATVTVPAFVVVAGVLVPVYAADVAGEISVSYAGDEGSGVYDTADGYAYKYVVSVKNTGSKARILTPGAITADAGWKAVFVDSEGYPVDGAGYELKGFDTTAVYVMLINETGDKAAQVPEITVNFSIDGVAQPFVKTLDAKAADVSEGSHSATGDDIDNSKEDIPTLFWGLVVLTILVFLLIVWGGMKRGVFSRKN